MRIPTRFKLLGQTITVKKKDEFLLTREALGTAVDCLNSIYLSSKVSVDGKWEALPKEQIEAVFCHELVHQILFKMSEHELNKNEKFVDMFGMLLHQFLTTSEYGK